MFERQGPRGHFPEAGRAAEERHPCPAQEPGWQGGSGDASQQPVAWLHRGHCPVVRSASPRPGLGSCRHRGNASSSFTEWLGQLKEVMQMKLMTWYLVHYKSN